MSNLRLTLCAWVVALATGSPAAASGRAPLTVTDAWVREAGSVSMNTSAYMTVRNPSAADVVIVGVHTPAAKVAELHEMRDDGGIMRMRRVDRFVVPAQGTLRLEPGGLHVMLFKLTAALRTGTTVSLELHTAGGERIATSALVRSLQ